MSSATYPFPISYHSKQLSNINNISSRLFHQDLRFPDFDLHSSIDADSSYNIGLLQCFYIQRLVGPNLLGCGSWIELCRPGTSVSDVSLLYPYAFYVIFLHVAVEQVEVSYARIADMSMPG